jgi:hypothetical protein
MITQIKEVKKRKDLRAFVHFPNQLYKDNLYYVPQIESMERDTLTPEKNHAFEVCFNLHLITIKILITFLKLNEKKK